MGEAALQLRQQTSEFPTKTRLQFQTVNQDRRIYIRTYRKMHNLVTLVMAGNVSPVSFAPIRNAFLYLYPKTPSLVILGTVGSQTRLLSSWSGVSAGRRTQSGVQLLTETLEKRVATAAAYLGGVTKPKFRVNYTAADRKSVV
jgi:hypothetical protein